jgi:N-glycosylase/DNA lyase
MIQQYQDIFEEIKDKVQQQLDSFTLIREKWDKKALFQEYCFCLLTPQSKARHAEKAIAELVKSNELYTAEAEDIAAYLNIVRFKNTKAKNIVSFRTFFFSKEGDDFLDFIRSTALAKDKRKRIVQEIKGMGFKEASHCLRNIGFYSEIAILDRHILRNLKYLNLIDEIPTTISEKIYLAMEEKMKILAEKTNIPMEFLDYVIWFKETKDIFK